MYKLEFHSPKDALYQVWLKLAQWFCSKKINFVFRRCILASVIISPLERGETLTLKKLECLMPDFVIKLAK